VAYTTAEARRQLLDALAEAADDLGVALAALSEAYELLDEAMADRLEQELFRPLQAAYGRAKRTHVEFAARHDLPPHEFEAAVHGAPGKGVKGFLDSAVTAIGSADLKLATLQDSMMPIEVGDTELRAGLEQVRSAIGDLRARAHQIVRTFGR
jgi:hypothetical protein